MQPIAGTMALKFPPAMAVTLGYEDFFWPSGNIQLDYLSWMHIGPAHFWDAEGVDHAFLHAKRHLAGQLQHYPTTADEMNKWREMGRQAASVLDEIYDQRKRDCILAYRMLGIRLVVCYTGNERKNVAEPAYLWIGDLLISFSNGYDPVPPTGLVQVPDSLDWDTFFVGIIKEGFDIDHMQAYVETYVESHPSPKFRGSHQDVEKWKNKEEEWRQKYGEFMKHR
ncbi:hypothetical protein EV360DRAFT_76478 [Lentinula raphanica]|nr:hypothetical protein EV360DRAFT_76478 [Lentinula raphanica]